MKSVLFIIAFEDFQRIEFYTPKKILEANDIEVVTGSDHAGAATANKTKEQAMIDVVLKDVRVADYDGVLIAGGPGALAHLDNKETYRILKETTESGKLIGAICISTRILAHSGVLKDKKATGWNGDDKLESILDEAKAIYTPQPVVADGLCITGTDPASAEEWGRKIVEIL